MPADRVLTGDGLTLEPLRVERAEEMASALGDPALHSVIGGRPASADELRARYARQLRGPADPSEEWCTWVVRDGGDGPLVGYVQATLTRDGARAELAWVVGTPWQGRGVARRAAALVLAEARRRGAEVVLAHVRPGHAPSEAVARSLGMRPTDVVVDGETRWSMETGRP
ncbi:GNAT family N-acetyltransferase [Phycicoccus jejuensis]|uniref:GNAT family N-acetyltransferase n=1 Tax=Phycicoccus jejuensis TaxID=367299 RepID=UPI00056D94D9|nr:GNAT family N-acetyltransferase [Phycicoccus jejuensis]